jgi:transcriptional/translational regulatory protein YebC/TACO1
LYAPFEFYGLIQKELENKNIEILSSGFERIPTSTKKLNEESRKEVESLIEKIEEDDDVQSVFHSLDLS